MAATRRRVTGLAVVGVIAAAAIGVARHRAPAVDAVTHPTPAEVVAAIGRGPAASPADTRRVRFCAMLQRRFRLREEALSVEYVGPRRIALTCSASMAAWRKADSAMQVANEAVAVFGTPTEVDIIDSYIATPRIKVAELRWNPAGTQATVTYDDRFGHERQGRRTNAPQPLRSVGADGKRESLPDR